MVMLYRASSVPMPLLVVMMAVLRSDWGQLYLCMSNVKYLVLVNIPIIVFVAQVLLFGTRP